MILIRPKAINESTLAASNVAETVTAWDSGTTYSEGDAVGITTGTTIALKRSTADGNMGNDPATATDWWADDGTTYAPYDADAIYAAGDLVIDPVAHRIHESLYGGISAAATMTIASPCVVTWTAHGQPAGAPILFTTTGALPTGLVAGTVYYVLAPTTDSFNLAATAGGAAIATSGSQSGTHTAVAFPNKGNPLTSAGWWLDIGPTNRWAMFDDVVGTATTHPHQIDVSMTFAGRVDGLALLGLANATLARITMTTVADGLVYDETFSLISTGGITDWYSYFFEDVARKEALIVRSLPAYADPTIRVVIEGDGSSPVECGILSAGLSKSIGETLHDGAQVGIIDYSRKAVDDFGNFSITERAFSKRASFRCLLPKAAVDGVQQVLADYRATPAVYVGADDYGATAIFGFFRDFSIEIAYPNESLCSIEIEGLT